MMGPWGGLLLLLIIAIPVTLLLVFLRRPLDEPPLDKLEEPGVDASSTIAPPVGPPPGPGINSGG